MKKMITRASTIGAVLVAMSSLLPATMSMAQDAVTLEGHALDKLDDNRFFTRLGGTVRDTLVYDGLDAGETYTASGQLYSMTKKQTIGEPVTLTFVAEEAAGTLDLEIDLPQNRTEFNIDFVALVNIHRGETVAGEIVASLDDLDDPKQTVQSHAIQGISVTATAADGSQALPGQGGTIVATVDYVNLVEGYAYTIWGQLLTESGQTVGVFSAIPEYAPESKAGTVTLEFEVPEGFEGINLIPTVGLYHKKRVTLNEDGTLTWIPGAPMPVQIASDLDLNDPATMISIGEPFVLE